MAAMAGQQQRQQKVVTEQEEIDDVQQGPIPVEQLQVQTPQNQT